MEKLMTPVARSFREFFPEKENKWYNSVARSFREFFPEKENKWYNLELIQTN